MPPAGPVTDVRLFLSFDIDHDMDLHDQFCEQAGRGGSGFEVSARSESGQVSDRWCESVRRRVRAADEVIVICGTRTEDSVRLHAELRIVQEEKKPYFLLWGRRDQMCTMPLGAPRTDCMYSWTWEIVTRQITDTIRNARPLEVPEEARRP